MNTINSYLINIITFLSINFCALNAGEFTSTELESDQTKEENKKKSLQGSYLEKLQRRYVSRLPYLMIPTMVIPVIKKGNLAGHLTIMVELKGNGVDGYRRLQTDSVKLRDEIFCDIYFAMSRLWLGPEAPAANILENRIRKRLNNFYKNEIVETARLHIMQLTLISST